MFDEYFVGNLWEDYDTPREGNILDESAFRGTNDPRPWASNISKTALEVRTYGSRHTATQDNTKNTIYEKKT